MEATGADFTMTFVGLMALTPEADDWRAEEVGGWVGGDTCRYVYVWAPGLDGCPGPRLCHAATRYTHHYHIKHPK